MDAEVAALPVASGLLLAHGLIWQKAVASGWRLLRGADSEASKFSGLATLWFTALVLFQVGTLGMLLLGLAFALGGPMVF